MILCPPPQGCLTGAYKTLRLNWCNRHKNFDWKRVHIFCDTTFVPMPTVINPVRTKKCLQTPGDRAKEYMQGKNKRDHHTNVPHARWARPGMGISECWKEAEGAFPSAGRRQRVAAVLPPGQTSSPDHTSRSPPGQTTDFGRSRCSAGTTPRGGSAITSTRTGSGTRRWPSPPSRPRCARGAAGTHY